MGTKPMTQTHDVIPKADDLFNFAPSLDTQETSVDLGRSGSFRAFYTSGLTKDVEFNGKIYGLLDAKEGSKRLATFNGCRTDAWFVRHTETRKVRIQSHRCNLRWCPLCIRTKRFIIQQSCIPWVLKLPAPKFVTFTLKHTEAPLEHQIDHLYQSFRKIRNNKLFKKSCQGGIWFFQIKRSKKDGLWHPHLHCLVESYFMNREDLRDAWIKVTGTSRIVDIRAVKDARKTAEYVSRYATSPCRLADLSEDDACDVVSTLHGRRLCGTWGTGKAIKLSPQKCDDWESWEKLAGFTEVMWSKDKNGFFREVYRAFQQETECFAVPPEPPPPPWEKPGTLYDEPVTYCQLQFEFEC